MATARKRTQSNHQSHDCNRKCQLPGIAEDNLLNAFPNACDRIRSIAIACARHLGQPHADLETVGRFAFEDRPVVHSAH